MDKENTKTEDSASRETRVPLGTNIVPPTIDTVTRLDVKRGVMWVLGYPCDIETDEMIEAGSDWHNCDEMGCSSAGNHVLAIVQLWPAAEVDPRLVGMPEQAPATQLADDMGLITARLIIQLLTKPRPNDRDVAAAWCRLCSRLDNVDVRHHFEAALSGRGDS